MTGCRHEWLSESRNAPYVRCGKCNVPKMAAYATGWEDAMRLAAADLAARDAVIEELVEACIDGQRYCFELHDTGRRSDWNTQLAITFGNAIAKGKVQA